MKNDPGSAGALRRAPLARGSRPRVLLYSHDTYGLGHLRRALLLAQAIVDLPERPAVLIATGSPRAQAFALPEGCDSLKLPALTKDAQGAYRARTLGVPLGELLELRTELLRSALRRFRPDLVLVDHAPAGAEGELRPLLHELAAQPERPALVLGLRDIIDEAPRVRAEWQRLGAWQLVDEIYDRVLVYGDPRVLTTAHELGLADRLRERLGYTGYLGREIAAEVAADEVPEVLVEVGGGGDGAELLRAFASFVEAAPKPLSFRATVITGPFLSPRRRAEIEARLSAHAPAIRVLDFVEGVEAHLGRAHGAISMGGYNAVVEILSRGIPALLVPREHPRREQILRAERLRGLAAIEHAVVDEQLVPRIGNFVASLVAQPRPARSGALDLDGVARVAVEVSRELRHRGERAAAARQRGSA